MWLTSNATPVVQLEIFSFVRVYVKSTFKLIASKNFIERHENAVLVIRRTDIFSGGFNVGGRVIHGKTFAAAFQSSKNFIERHENAVAVV